jgi:hypothetical protein
MLDREICCSDAAFPITQQSSHAELCASDMNLDETASHMTEHALLPAHPLLSVFATLLAPVLAQAL